MQGLSWVRSPSGTYFGSFKLGFEGPGFFHHAGPECKTRNLGEARGPCEPEMNCSDQTACGLQFLVRRRQNPPAVGCLSLRGPGSRASVPVWRGSCCSVCCATRPGPSPTVLPQAGALPHVAPQERTSREPRRAAGLTRHPLQPRREETPHRALLPTDGQALGRREADKQPATPGPLGSPAGSRGEAPFQGQTQSDP